MLTIVTKRSFVIALYASLAISALPLACGDDEASPSAGDGAASGSGGEAAGGSAGEQSTGGNAGRAGGSGGSAVGGASGGSSGRGSGGTNVGGAGGAPGGEAGVSGTGGASEGGVGGASDGGAGGEGGVDEETARCRRICRKAEPAMCPNMAGCVENFCEFYFNPYPECRPYADVILACLDERATPEDFVCWQELPSHISQGGTCWPEIQTAIDAYCL